MHMMSRSAITTRRVLSGRARASSIGFPHSAFRPGLHPVRPAGARIGHSSSFRMEREISPGKMHQSVPARAPELRGLTVGRESFAVTCPLTLVGPASYPVAVRRPTDLAPRCGQRSPHGRHLAVHSSRGDQLLRGLYLHVDYHAGHTVAVARYARILLNSLQQNLGVRQHSGVRAVTGNRWRVLSELPMRLTRAGPGPVQRIWDPRRFPPIPSW